MLCCAQERGYRPLWSMVPQTPAAMLLVSSLGNLWGHGTGRILSWGGIYMPKSWILPCRPWMLPCSCTRDTMYICSLITLHVYTLHTLSSWYSKSECFNPRLWNMWKRFRDSRVNLSLEYVHTSVHRSDVLSRHPWYTPLPVHISEYQGPVAFV